MDDFSLSDPLALGIVLDISQQRDSSSRKYLDIVIKTIRHSVKSDSDYIVYVAHQDNTRLPRNTSESLTFLAKYVDPLEFFVGKEFRRAVNMIGSADDDYRKKVILFTDRYKPKLNPHYWSGFIDNRSRQYGIDIEVCGIGNFFDERSLKRLVDDHNGSFVHVQNAEELNQYIEGVTQ